MTAPFALQTPIARPSRRPALAMWVAAVALASGACAPAGTASGTHEGRQFAVNDDSPQVRRHGGDTTIVLSQAVSAVIDGDGEETTPSQLWLVMLTLPREFKIQDGVPTALGPKDSELPYLQVAVGELVVDEVGDVRVANTKHTQFIAVDKGTVIFWSTEKLLVADFEASLEGGGEITGSVEIGQAAGLN